MYPGLVFLLAQRLLCNCCPGILARGEVQQRLKLWIGEVQ